ncbi:hypothetical protein NX794_07540 [Streptomyces sp. LP11]|uniref:Uncharacterized protein n=1 Tax=Streptomyces pyxinicus TaxID=2970331 RepID=A0ABT2AZH2_9ACTN|nr:hypothetical protein [Streptomyces sp. LP11]MCS0601083.1 hypothetical protein [Streptomyces sp. LP11]
MKPSRGENFAATLVLLIGVVASVWVWTSAPCGVWSFSKVGEMPARCLTK